MYLQKLYQHNKPWFFVTIFFIAGQLLINYNRGVVCTPFYHYGMYSEVIKPANQYTIPEVYINNERLAAKNFTPQQWDNIMQPVIKFHRQKDGNLALFQKDIKRIMPFTNEARFINNISEKEFNYRYKEHLENITGKKINAVKIIYQDYFFYGASFSKANTLRLF